MPKNISRFGPLYATPRPRSPPPPVTIPDPFLRFQPLPTPPHRPPHRRKDPTLMAAVAANRDYVAALEQELAKIQAFQRELPLSLDLVTRTIESCRRALLLEEEDEGPLQIEEFMPMKGNLLAQEDEERNRGGPHQDKADWLRSAQLWNQHQQLEQSHNDVAMEAEGPAVAMADASDAGSDGPQGGDTGSSADRDGGEAKKERRCWSLDLHRRFLDALQELGGPNVATPKQIKELMNVDGLTSDEIKSHLQKHRIRSKRPAEPATLTAANAVMNGQPQVLLGIWVPQGDYAAVAAAAAAAIASLPLEPKQKKQRRQKQSKNGESVAHPRNANSTGSNTTSL